MSIDKITDKILKDASLEAEKIKGEAEVQAQQLIDDAEKRAKQLTEEAQVKGAAEEDGLEERRKSVAYIDCRKLILEEKQKIIDECFDSAKELIIGREDVYLSFLLGIIKSSGVKAGEIIMNARDKAEIGSKLIQKIKNDFPGSELMLSEETAKIEGGLIIKSGKICINGSLEGYAQEAREELAADIAAKLFG